MMVVTVGAVARGTAIGLCAALAIGFAVCFQACAFDWPTGVVEPSEKARHLAESISEGMHWAFLSALVTLPAAIVWSLRRSRRRASQVGQIPPRAE